MYSAREEAGNVTGRARAGKAHAGEAGHRFIVKLNKTSQDERRPIA